MKESLSELETSRIGSKLGLLSLVFGAGLSFIDISCRVRFSFSTWNIKIIKERWGNQKVPVMVHG